MFKVTYLIRLILPFSLFNTLGYQFNDSLKSNKRLQVRAEDEKKYKTSNLQSSSSICIVPTQDTDHAMHSISQQLSFYPPRNHRKPYFILQSVILRLPHHPWFVTKLCTLSPALPVKLQTRYSQTLQNCALQNGQFADR